ncbi:MAG: hypothetical protein R2688_01940 [Fimbriimonadaceae bacterium]
MPTKAEFKMGKRSPKLKIRTGDRVMIISGKDKGQRGFVAAVAPKDYKAIVLQDNPENPEQASAAERCHQAPQSKVSRRTICPHQTSGSNSHQQPDGD